MTDPGLRSQREAQIAEGALDLFLDKGFHATSVREIAAAAGLSMGGLYQYIDSKDDVLTLVYRNLVAGLEEALPDEDGAVDLEAGIVALLEASAVRARQVQLLYREAASLDPEHRDQLAEAERARIGRLASWIQQGVDAGTVLAEDAEAVAHFLAFLAAFVPLRRWVLRHRSDLTTADLVSLVARVVARGLRPEASRSGE